MKKKLLYLTITILSLFLFANCSSDENTETKESTCKILKYDRLALNIYQTEFVYENGRMIKRQNYGNTLPVTTGQTLLGLISEDDILYNQNNNVEKIIYKKDKHYDVFFYEGNSKLPYKRENIKISDDGNYTAKWVENIQYDSQNRIIKTIGGYDDETENRKITNMYTYDSNGNLSQTSERKTLSDGTTIENIIEFYNYDSNKNPFKNITVPFVDCRTKNYSKNNYRGFIHKSIQEGNTTIGYHWEISSYQYNEFGYPLFAEYECN